jgi:hypothetical protein
MAASSADQWELWSVEMTVARMVDSMAAAMAASLVGE